MKQEIERLREEIRGHEYRYYVENAPTISDQEFDALMHQLIKLEAENPDCFDPNSPTQRVGSDLAQSGFEQVEHRYPMLSLGNTYSEGEVREWYNRILKQITDNGLQSADNFQLSTLNSYDVLVINTIGLLSSIYQYGQVAYIGGGFGVGIHNTLEAAAWGMPVVFGPNYKKFKEACELLECGAARSIETKEECFAALDEFFERNAEPANAATEYVSSHVGATNLIYKNIVNN